MRHDRQSSNMHVFRFGLTAVCFCLAGTASAQTQIHKCTDADGGVVYSQLPCASQESMESQKTELETKVEREPPDLATQELSISGVPQEEPEPETNR